MASFVARFLPTLDRIRSRVPTQIGVRSATLVVKKTIMSGTMLDDDNTLTTVVTPIVSRTGDRYKVKSLSTKDVVSSGGKYQNGSLKVGPITPPYPGSGFTLEDLVPSPVAGQEVYYGITDQTGVIQWCQMVDADTVNDLHWYITLNPTGVTP